MNINNIKSYISPVDDLKADKSAYLKSGVAIVKDGDWDKQPLNIKESQVYQSIQLLLEGKSFEDTPIYFVGKKILERGDPAWGHKTLQEFKEQRGQEILTLYHSIKAVGVLPIERINPLANPLDNISIAIGRNGELLVFDGMHRYCIAKILGKKDIPVNIVVRHADWITKRDELIKKIGKTTYNPIDHPDFEDIPSTWTSWRFKVLFRDLRNEDIHTIIDLGAHYGYFASELAKEGYICTAIEKGRGYFEIMQQLKMTNPFWFKTQRADILLLEKIEADCILALNIFHHFLKTEETYKKLVDMLGKIKSNVMYFQAHSVDELQMVGAYKNYTPEEFCQFILENSQYSSCVLVGEVKGRKIFKFK